MSTIRYLCDLKNRRAFCLGDRYYSEMFNDEKQRPVPLQTIVADMADARTDKNPFYTSDLARRLWAFCEVAGWDVELRYDTHDYDGGVSGPGNLAIVGSVWQCRNDDDFVVEDPCAELQRQKELEAGRSMCGEEIPS